MAKLEKCPICSSENLSVKKVDSRTNKKLNISICKNCYHRFINEYKFEDIYSTGDFTKIARGNTKKPSKEKIYSLDKKAFERINFYKKIIKDFDNTLEIGSSIGSFVHLLKLKEKKATGIEPDIDYAAFSNEQYGFDQLNGMFEDFQFEQSFNSICSFHVLEHINDLEKFIKKVDSVVQPGGKVLFEMPSFEIHNYGNLKSTYWEPHLHYFTQPSLYYLFSQFFNVIKQGYYGASNYIYAEKSSTNTFSKATFRRLKRKSRVVYFFSHFLPSISIREIPIRQLFLQPFFERNINKWIKKLIQFTHYGIKEKIYVLKESKRRVLKKAIHFTYYKGWENIGDTVLSKCVRDTFHTKITTGWNLQYLTNEVNNNTIKEINNSQFLLLGGGGVFIPDTNPNSKSGWQWAISKEQIDKIDVPVILYAIGYNYFHGQEPNEFFINNLKYIIDKANFVGLRNHGSINKVSRLIGDELSKKLTYQPCPTTIIRKLYPNLPKKKKTKNIALNIAYDRYNLRFGEKIYTIHNQLAKAIKVIENKGYNIFLVCHINADSKFQLSLDKQGINYKTVYLNFYTPMETYRFYNEMDLVMGMRGHAQMIPFGLNCHILSLGTHDKMRYFINDLGDPDWYIDLKKHANNLQEVVLEKFENEYERKFEINKQLLLEKQEYLYNVSKENLDKITSIL